MSVTSADDGAGESGTDDGTGQADSGTASATAPPGSEVGEVGEASADDETGDVVPTECWQVEPMFEAPADVGILATDQNFDGRDELWVFFDSDGGQGPGETTVFAFDGGGNQLAEVTFFGFIIAIGDIDGDALRDLVTIEFGMGPPSFGFLQSIGDAAFIPPSVPLDLELSQSISGFFDATGDGPADVFSLADDGRLELLLGDGLGGFTMASDADVGAVEFVNVAPIEEVAGQAILASVSGFGGGDPDCLPTQYRLLDATDGSLAVLASSDDAPVPALGPLRGTGVLADSSTVLYVDTCEPGSELHDVRQLVWSAGSSVLAEFPAASGKQWATVGDLDGDGIPDLAFAEPDADTMSLQRGVADLSFGDVEQTTVELLETRDNNVRTLDMDGDGRDELVRGTVIADGDPAQLIYERVYLGPC